MSVITKTNDLVTSNYKLINKVLNNVTYKKKYLVNKDLLLSSEDLKQEVHLMLISSIQKDINNSYDIKKYTKRSSLTNICRFLLNNYVRKYFSEKQGGSSCSVSIEDVSEKHFISFFNEEGFRGDFRSLLLNLTIEDTDLDMETTEAFKLYYGKGYTLEEVSKELGLSASTIKRKMDTSLVSFVNSIHDKVSDLGEYHSA